MTRNPERGGGRIKAIIWLLILGLLIYLGVKIVPAYINNYQLEDTIKGEARFAQVNRRTPEQLRDAVYRKVQELGIPARREDVRVEPVTDGYRISVQYTVLVPIFGYQLSLNFHPAADNRSL